MKWPAHYSIQNMRLECWQCNLDSKSSILLVKRLIERCSITSLSCRRDSRTLSSLCSGVYADKLGYSHLIFCISRMCSTKVVMAKSHCRLGDLWTGMRKIVMLCNTVQKARVFQETESIASPILSRSRTTEPCKAC